MKRSFKRSSGRRNRSDDKGSIQVKVAMRINGKGYKHGNITRTFTVSRSRVSRVARAVERALFGDAA